METYVHHNKWFNADLGYNIFRCKIENHGFTYSTLRIKRLNGTKSRKKYFLFGPIVEVPVYVTVTLSHRDDNVEVVINRQSYYSAYGIKKKIEQILKYYPIETGVYEHSKNI